MSARAAAKSQTCFTAGTVVATTDGSLAIEELRVGNRVKTNNEKHVPSKVTADWRIVELDMPNPDGRRGRD